MNQRKNIDAQKRLENKVDRWKMFTIIFGIIAVFFWMLILIPFVIGATGSTSTFLRADEYTVDAAKLLGAGIASIGFIGAGMGQGFAAGKAAEGVARNPEAEGKIRNMMIIGAAIAETSALYALVVAILLIFVA